MIGPALLLSCQPAMTTCTGHADCPSDQLCVADICRKVCNSSVDCTDDTSCQDGVCLPQDTVRSDAAVADRSLSDHAVIDASLSADAGAQRDGEASADVSALDTSALDSAAFDSQTSDTSRPDASLHDTSRPDASQPDTSLPDVSLPDVSQPDTSRPDVSRPDTLLPDTTPPRCAPAAPWVTNNLSRRVPICFEYQDGTESLSDFPVLVVLDDERMDIAAAEPNGSDLRFYDSVGTPIPAEIERWEPSGSSYVWVRVPQIPALSSAAHIWLYYGTIGPSIAPPSPVDVWSNGFELVYHLSETSGQHQDSSGNGRDATERSNAGQGVEAGLVAGGDEFVGAGDSMDVPVSDAWDFTEAITVEGWILRRDTDRLLTIMCRWFGGNDVFHLTLGDDSSGLTPYFRVSHSGSAGPMVDCTRAIPADSAFHYVVGSFDGPTQTLAIFVDGASCGSASTSGTQLYPIEAGLDVSGFGALGREVDGFLDELRISSTARSEAWTLAQYRSIRDELLFFGTEQLR